jgi:hypothetical protein
MKIDTSLKNFFLKAAIAVVKQITGGSAWQKRQI